MYIYTALQNDVFNIFFEKDSIGGDRWHAQKNIYFLYLPKFIAWVYTHPLQHEEWVWLSQGISLTKSRVNKKP